MTNEDIINDIVEISEGLASKVIGGKTFTFKRECQIKQTALEVAGQIVKTKIQRGWDTL